jgi:hypothetical protein
MLTDNPEPKKATRMRCVYRNLLPALTYLYLCLFSTACGTTLIRDQSESEMSAATMYIYFYHGLIKDVFFRNRDTGEEYSNGMYGWAKDYFPGRRQYTYFAIGNLPTGRYELHKLNLYFDGQTSMIEIPPTAIRFELKASEIKYLGEYVLGYAKSGLRTESDSTHIKRVFFHSSQSDMLVTCAREADVRERDESESAFLRFFVAKKGALPAWSRLAEARLRALDRSPASDSSSGGPPELCNL